MGVLFLADLAFLGTEMVRNAGIPNNSLSVTLRALLRPSTDRERGVARGYWSLHLLAALGLGYLVANRPRRHQPEDASGYGSHGTARWASERELRQDLKAFGPGLILGKLHGRYLIHPPDPWLPHNQLVVVIGGSGSRKTRTFVMPNLLHEREASLVVMDPKGENYAKSSHVLRARGYQVQVLNLLSMAHSDRWNPLDYVQGVTEAADLAFNLVSNTVNPNRARGDPFWDNAEQSLITALVLYVKRHCPEDMQHMASVVELGTGVPAPVLDEVFLKLPPNDPAFKFYRTFLSAEEKVRGGILAGFGARLQLWNSDEVTTLTASSDIRLERLGQDKIALFLVVPDSKGTYAPLLALFWQQVFQVLYAAADETGGELPRRVRCRMDEFCNCGFIPEIEKKLSTMRSRGVSVEMVLQTIDQLKNRYPQTWTEMLGNCDTWLYLGGNDLETAKYISEKLGTTTILVQSRSQSTTDRQSASQSDSTSYQQRALMTPDEVLQLPTGQALLIRKGCPPARVRKSDYTEHPDANLIQLARHREYAVPECRPFRTLEPRTLVADIPRRTAAPTQAGKGGETQPAGNQAPADPQAAPETGAAQQEQQEAGGAPQDAPREPAGPATEPPAQAVGIPDISDGQAPGPQSGKEESPRSA